MYGAMPSSDNLGACLQGRDQTDPQLEKIDEEASFANSRFGAGQNNFDRLF